MKGTLKKLTAWLLSIAMVMSLFTGVLPFAFAEGESDSAPETTPEVTDNRDFGNSDVTRRPRLYVDFLGDNYTYNPLGVKTPGALAAPGTEDQNKNTNDNGTNTWAGYTPDDVIASQNNSNGTIFWVGVGIDRMNELDLFRQNDSGIYSLELGFYYDNEFIEPYTGLSDGEHTEEEIRESYKQVIENANLRDYDTFNWNKNHQYKIVAAETGLMPQSDRVTQESISAPMMYSDGSDKEAIMTEGNNWRMTYVSLERKEEATSNRFAGWYNPGEENDKDTQYLLIIPFRLKKYDNNYQERVCLRLTRSAGLFSIGGKDGDTPYAAWERVTTRNFNRELKLMTNFMGDLNIFTGQRQADELYTATLDTQNGGGTGNTVDLYVTNDPSPSPVHARLNGEAIEKLAGGVGMSVDVVCQSGYDVTVRVYYEVPDGGSGTLKVDIPYTRTIKNDNESNYAYIMPDHDVIVEVKFSLSTNKEFMLYLDEDHSKEEPADPANTEIPKPNNRTELVATRATDVVTVNEDSDKNNYLNLPGEKVTVDSPPDTVLEVNVTLHNDYYAEVEIYNEATRGYMQPDMKPGDASVDAVTDKTPPYALADEQTYYVVTMPTSGTLKLNRMPQSDLVVKVTYKPADKCRATLEVWHEGIPAKDSNVAQLETTVYTDANEPMKAYSGVVYNIDDPENHRAVEDGFRVLEKVDASAAHLSGSLGGDGDPPMAWGDATPAPDSFMTLLYEAYHSVATPTLADFANEVKAGLSAYDLRKLDIAGNGSNLGLRKNGVGEFYTDADVANTASDLYVRLFDLATMAAAVPADYVNEVKDGGGNLLYTHFTLTPAQVQAYLLDSEDPLAAAVIKDNTAAEAAVQAHAWYDAADTHYPPTDGQPEDANGKKACYLEARPGRQMAVILEADSADTLLKAVELIDPTGVVATVNLQKDPNYQNVYLFDMPNYDCIVKVTYTKRETHRLDIAVQGLQSNQDNTDNTVVVRAYTPKDNSTTAKAETWNNYLDPENVPGNKTGNIENVLEGSTVTVTIQWAEGYQVNVNLQNPDGTPGRTWTSFGPASNLTNGKPFTFIMPEDDLELLVQYVYDETTYKATLTTRDYDSNYHDSGNKALWNANGSTVRSGLHGGDPLNGTVTVAPGYYIYSVEGFTADGAYPVVIDGNGWNNGGGGTVNLDTVMPPADYEVRVTFRKGPPPEEPGKALTLRVKDPDNTGSGDPAVYADNWAKTEVTRTNSGAMIPVDTLGEVGRARGKMDDTTWDAAAGDLVTVEFHPAAGYYVESVEVQPASLGGALQWTSTNTAEFVMPAGSAEVVVTFAEGEKDPRQFILVVDKTERGDGAPEENNYIRDVDSPTLRGAVGSTYTVGQVALPHRVPQNTGSAGGDTGVALPGETVTIGINVEAGWYIHSVTTTDNWGRLPCTLSGNGYNNGSGGTVTASFVMPPSDVSAVVNYRKGPPPEKETDHILEVIVADPDNTGSGDPVVYNNNWAQGSAPSLGSATIGPVGLATGNGRRASDYVQMGDLVTIDYEADSGYALDIIVVTPTGLHITPTYLGSTYDAGTGKSTGQAQFTMPDENTTVLVRFKKGDANRYTANLILRMPSGVAISDYDQVGQGSFAGASGNDPAGGIYSKVATAGEPIDFAALARNGYYIDRITITPAALGVPYTFSGSFAWQEGTFVMPAADVQVNVWFAKLWPDEVEYDLTLKVYDPTGGNSTANFNTIAGTALTAPDNNPVGHGESNTLKNKAHDLDRVMVELTPGTDRYVKKVTVTDSRSQVRELPWDYVPGGIAFDMTPAHVTVTVWYAMRTETEHEERSTVTLHTSGNTGTDGATLVGTDYSSTAFTLNNSGSKTNVPAGSTLTLTATPENGHSVVAAYAVSASGGQLLVPMTLVTSGGTVDFAMPAEDADVYVVFLDAKPDQGESPATLVVAGPSGSGYAELSATVGGNTRTTGDVNAAGAGSIFAPPGTELTVDLTVNPNYSIASIRVVNAQGGNVPYTWTDGNQRQFTLTMPTTDGGVRIYVELEEVDPNKNDLTAQVVVNDGGNAGNTAKLRRDGAPSTDGADRLTSLTVGDGISLDLVVKPGYKVDYIKVVPAKYGIQPSLSDSITSQTTGFTMPGEDVVVYVKFSEDKRTRKTVTLKATGDSESGEKPENKATIHSAYSGTQRPVVPPTGLPPDGMTSVQAAPATATMPAEWVTVDYYWAEGYVPTVTVIEDGSNTPVPFTQYINDTTNRRGQIRFPMVDEDEVIVTVHYAKEPVTYPAVIHVIDLDDPAANSESWGELIWTTEDTHEIMALPAPGGTATIQVPAGEEVTVNIFAQGADGDTSKTYIQAAYVIYRDGGQMINFNLDPDDPGPGFSGNKEDKFVMHPGQNDVYVYFTKTEPKTTDYAAVLMLDSDEDDTTSKATITNTNARPYQADSATVVANGSHGYVTATDGDTITVTVDPAAGYVIDSILMTPLGTSTDQGGTVALIRKPDGSYEFTMPAKNVAVRVKLKASSSGEYKAMLHYRMQDGSYTDPEKDWAMLSYEVGGITYSCNQDEDILLVDENIRVTVGVSVTDPNLVLSAYVLQSNGALVPLAPKLEGTVEGLSKNDNTVIDATAQFIMPAADVDVFIWFTNTPPAEEWYTAVLTVTDDNGAGTINSGRNSAQIWVEKDDGTKDTSRAQTVYSNGIKINTVTGTEAKHKYMWVKVGETVKVKTDLPADDYVFHNPATITHSDGGSTPVLSEDDSQAPSVYTYAYTVEAVNSAVVAHFVNSTISQNDLRVEIVDRDNPGNGTVTNSVRVSPALMTALTVNSTTSAGAWQRIPGVTAGTDINFKVIPDNSDYAFVVQLIDPATGNATRTWYNDTDQFSMPNQKATLRVTFFKSRTVTLSVWDTSGVTTDTDATATAKMVENTFNGQVTANTTRVPSSLPVPDGTKLTTTVTPSAGVRIVGVLAMVNGGSTWLSPTDVDGKDEYYYTISGNDVEIRVFVEPDDVEPPTDKTYLASVSAVNLPADTTAPTIHVTPTPNAMEGPGWTAAKAIDTVTDTVEITVDVPYGYKAVLTTTAADDAPLTAAEIDGSSAAVTGGKASFVMPAHNVHVKVTYVKTRFTATIKTVGNGTATLSDGTQTVTAMDTISGLLGGETLTYTATANSGSTLTAILWQEAGGSSRILTHTGGTGSETMPPDNVTITAFFEEDETDRPYIAYVSVEGRTDGLPQNSAQNIVNTSETLGGGTLWTYGKGGNNILTTFTVAPGYTAVVKAERLDTNDPVSVVQQGAAGTGTAALTSSAETATLTMPNADVKITITYYGPDDPPPELESHELKLRLVGHDGVTENAASLTGGAAVLQLDGSMKPDGSDVVSVPTTANLGDRLDLDAARHQNYIIVKATIEYEDPVTHVNTVITLNLNEYGTTKAGRFTMPDADTLVTVYYRMPYTATLLVVDANGDDYAGVAADTVGSSIVPKVTLEVDNIGSTTKTHTPIEGLYGTETVVATVDLTTLNALSPSTEIASVVATTSSGTVHLTETAQDSGIYEYEMSEVGAGGVLIRRADDVVITVILRKDNDPMYTATVYKQGHDDKPDNSATIRNTTTAGLPTGVMPAGSIWAGDTVWTGAYVDDVIQVDVTTDPAYYAVVTAVDAAGNDVPILQYAIQGTAADPIVTRFLMPAADVDVTVTYSTTLPDSGELYLELIGHKQHEDNWDEIYEMADENTPPDLTVPTPPSPDLAAAGDEALSDSNFRKGPQTVEPGKYLWELPDHGDAYYIKSVIFVPTGFSDTDTAFISVLATDEADQFRMPLGGGTLKVEFAPGKKSGRPYDPEHSERYNGTSLTPPGNYDTGGTGDDNPDLTVAPTEGQQGWILAEAPDSEKKTVVVTVPTLYDNEESDDVKALTDAGVAPAAEGEERDTPPTYQFYWWDKDASAYKLLVLDTDYTVTAVPLDYNATPNENPKGEYPAGEHHYGYRLTLQAVDGSTAPLAEYIESGGEIYVTATRPGNVLPEDTVPWVESDKTQVIIRPENGLRPYDPDRVDDPNYEDHWIRAENRGDYLVVTVPMLNNRKGDKPTSVDGEIHRLQLHLQVDGTDRNSTIVNVTQLLSIVNINGYDHPVNANPLYDPTWTAGPPLNYLNEEIYENEIYYTDPGADGVLDTEDDIPYTGARFVVVILTDEEIEALGLDAAAETAAKGNAEILRKIFDNDGTMNADTTKQHRMYITSDVVKTLADPLPTSFKKEDYADFEVPRYYSFTGILESYAPQHIATFSLYPLEGADPANPDPTDPNEYGTKPVLIHKQFRDSGTDLWRLDFAMKSSELMGDDRLGVTYKLEIKKAGHINFTWLELTLSPDTLDDPSDPECLTFTVAAYDDAGNLDDTALGVIALIGGDINDDGYARMEDFTVLMSFIGGQRKQNRTKDPTGDPLNPPTDAQLKKWALSAYNPDSPTYWADLNGDGTVGSADVAIWNAKRNYNKSFRAYTSDPDYMASLRTTAAAATNVLELALLTEEILVEELPDEAALPAETDPAIPAIDGEEGEAPTKETEAITPSENEESGEDLKPSEPEEQAPSGQGEEPEPDKEEPAPALEEKEPSGEPEGSDPDPEVEDDTKAPGNSEEPTADPKLEASGAGATEELSGAEEPQQSTAEVEVAETAEQLADFPG